MIEVVPFEPKHLEGLILQKNQKFFQHRLDSDEFRQEAGRSVYARTGLFHGKPFGAAGIFPQTEWLGLAWCLFGNVPSNQWIRVFRECKKGVDWASENGFTRIEALVKRGFMPGARLAHMVGLRYEVLLEGWMPDGSDVWQYVKVPKWTQ